MGGLKVDIDTPCFGIPMEQDQINRTRMRGYFGKGPEQGVTRAFEVPLKQRVTTGGPFEHVAVLFRNRAELGLNLIQATQGLRELGISRLMLPQIFTSEPCAFPKVAVDLGRFRVFADGAASHVKGPLPQPCWPPSPPWPPGSEIPAPYSGAVSACDLCPHQCSCEDGAELCVSEKGGPC
jgi:hypothetical protein